VHHQRRSGFGIPRGPASIAESLRQHPITEPLLPCPLQKIAPQSAIIPGTMTPPAPPPMARAPRRGARVVHPLPTTPPHHRRRLPRRPDLRIRRRPQHLDRHQRHRAQGLRRGRLGAGCEVVASGGSTSHACRNMKTSLPSWAARFGVRGLAHKTHGPIAASGEPSPTASGGMPEPPFRLREPCDPGSGESGASAAFPSNEMGHPRSHPRSRRPPENRSRAPIEAPSAGRIVLDGLPDQDEPRRREVPHPQIEQRLMENAFA